ncbi:MAG: phospholipase D family protein [Pseudomonadales bacterium]
MLAGLRYLLIPTLLLWLGGCIYLPRSSQLEPQQILPTGDTKLAQQVAELPVADARLQLVNDPHEALVWRLELIEAAQVSLDVQYYLWHGDTAGIMLMQRLLQAADRGVRVRLLVDDIMLAGSDSRILALSRHPNLDIRLFNPFTVRTRVGTTLARMGEFLLDAKRLNHRMHNKMLVADSSVGILGGRNIGDEYMGLHPRAAFYDLDIAVAGAVLKQVGASFDAYWNSRWAYPIDVLVFNKVLRPSLEKVRAQLTEQLSRAPELPARLAEPPSRQRIDALIDQGASGQVQVLYDEPKVGPFDSPSQLARQIADLVAATNSELVIVSAYLVLRSAGIKILQERAAAGVRVVMLTNSLASNNHTMANSGFARRRKALLDAGIELYELRHDASLVGRSPQMPADARLTMHAKYMLFDDQVFIGSYNLDPRSAILNTEIGLLIRSEVLTEAVRDMVRRSIAPDNAWRVRKTAEGLRWQSAAGELNRQPALGWWQRFQDRFFRLLPLDRQL